MKKIKKFSIGIGTFATILVPATIVACGDDKTEFDFMKDLAKITLLTSTKNRAVLKTAVEKKGVGDAVTITELGITTPELSSGIVVTYAVKTVYSTEMGTIVVTATLTKDGVSATKDIKITAKAFDFSVDKNEFQDVVSTKFKAALKTAVGTKGVGDAVTITELGIAAPELSSGIVVTYAVKTVYSIEMGTIVVTATLTKDGVSTTKDITIKAFTFVDDLAKIELKQTSTKNKAALKTAVGTKGVGDAVTITELGIAAPELSSGIVATYAIKKVYQALPGVSIIEVTLTKDTQRATKIFSITAKMFDFISDKNKFVSFESTKNVNALKAIFAGESSFMSTKKVTAQELGITTPGLSPGVSVKYTYITESGYVFLILVTFTKDTEESAKGIRVITQSTTLSDDIKGISKDFTSIKNKVDFNNDIGSKIAGGSLTKDELGLLSFLPSDVTATYVVKTVYDASTSKIIVTMTLTKDGLSAEKELSIIAKIPSGQKT